MTRTGQKEGLWYIRTRWGPGQDKKGQDVTGTGEGGGVGEDSFPSKFREANQGLTIKTNCVS